MGHPAMRPDSHYTAARVAELESAGLWGKQSIRDLLREAALQVPDSEAAVDYGADGVRRGAVTYQELDAEATRIARGLAASGVRPGDSVGVLMPNSIAFAASIFAVAELGAVYTGLPPGYGRREIAAVLERSGSRVVLVHGRLRGGRSLAEARAVAAELGTIETLVVVSPDDLDQGEVAFDELGRDGAPFNPGPVDPRSLAYVPFTSGTTGEPKGVMHSHQTILGSLVWWNDHVGPDLLGTPHVNLIACTMGHNIGFAWGCLMAVRLRGRAVYLERWDPRTALTVAQAEGVTFFSTTPTQLQDLRLSGAARDIPVPTLSLIGVAGSTIPRDLVAELRATMGCYVCPGWGMTEWGIAISAAPHLPGSEDSDGRPLAVCEARIVGAGGAPTGTGEVGRLEIRGPGLFWGYLNRPTATAEAFHPGGWLRTGDLARWDTAGNIHLHGREKEIIIRGGENIPVVEVEQALLRHPAVDEVALVGVPDERLGECVGCVVVGSLGPDGLASLHGFLGELGFARQFRPERLAVVPTMPRTPSGKIKKRELVPLFDADLGRETTP